MESTKVTVWAETRRGEMSVTRLGSTRDVFSVECDLGVADGRDTGGDGSDGSDGTDGGPLFLHSLQYQRPETGDWAHFGSAEVAIIEKHRDVLERAVRRQWAEDAAALGIFLGTLPLVSGESGFRMSPEQREKVDAWIASHDAEKHVEPGQKYRYAGAIGGAYAYCFTPNSIGVVVVVRCACGDKIDVSDYDLW